MAAELVHLQPAVIYAGGSVRAAKAATTPGTLNTNTPGIIMSTDHKIRPKTSMRSTTAAIKQLPMQMPCPTKARFMLASSKLTISHPPRSKFQFHVDTFYPDFY
jgi:hypothetical protein